MVRIPPFTRRSFLKASGSAAAAAATLAPWSSGAASAITEYHITARPGRVPLVGAPNPETRILGYDGQVPGPQLRVCQSERLHVTVENRLREETTVHWHGVRAPNAMDGVPHLTQKPIAPGETFVYEFDVPGAGTYWHHPHQRSFEQVGRGLYGPLMVEEREPVAVDRDVIWMLGDWRLRQDALILDDFGNRMDISMTGRIGNTVTINGRLPTPLKVQAGERLRSRLFAVRDSFYPTNAYTLSEIVYGNEAPVRRDSQRAPVSLPPNTMPEPSLDRAERHEVAFGRSMMGMMHGGMMGMMTGRGVWSINGVSVTGHVHEPLLHLKLGRSYILALRNETAWHHPIHLHGHSFRVTAHNGTPTRLREWRDTVFTAPRERSTSPASPTIAATE